MSGLVDEEMRDEEGEGEGGNGERGLPVTPPEFVLLRTADGVSYGVVRGLLSSISDFLELKM